MVLTVRFLHAPSIGHGPVPRGRERCVPRERSPYQQLAISNRRACQAFTRSTNTVASVRPPPDAEDENQETGVLDEPRSDPDGQAEGRRANQGRAAMSRHAGAFHDSLDRGSRFREGYRDAVPS